MLAQELKTLLAQIPDDLEVTIAVDEDGDFVDLKVHNLNIQTDAALLHLEYKHK